MDGGLLNDWQSYIPRQFIATQKPNTGVYEFNQPTSGR